MVHLDLKESAQQGMGPHGLVIGATGSGQVGAPAHPGARAGADALARAAEPRAGRLQGRRDVRRPVRAAARVRADHQPRPGAHARRPHAGRALRRAGTSPGAAAARPATSPPSATTRRPGPTERTWRRCRRCWSSSTSSPSCSSARPEFIDLFVAIGRLGRSLGLHLLLASQRLEEGRLRGLESHLSYRVGLRTFSAGRVPRGAGRPGRLRAAGGPRAGLPQAGPVDDAPVPGGLRVRAAAGDRPAARRTPGSPREILPFDDLRGAPARRPTDRSRPRRATGRAGVAARPRRSAAGGPRTARAPGVAAPARPARHARRADGRPHRGPAPGSGLPALARPRRARGPARHRRPPARAAPRPAHGDLGGAGGHVAVVGGPRSGKSTLLRTIVASLSLTHDPAGDPVLRPRLRRRHVRAARPAPARRGRRNAVRARRRTPDPRRGAGRRGPPRGLLPRAGHRLHRDLPVAPRGGPRRRRVRRRLPRRGRLEHAPRRLRRPRGRAAPARHPGAHVRPARGGRDRAAGRTSGPRCATSSAPGWSCDSGDPVDSEVDRRVAALVPSGRPGRGLVPGPLHFLAALPRIDGVRRADTLAEGVEDLVARVRPAGPGRAGPGCGCCPSGSTSTPCAPRPRTCGDGRPAAAARRRREASWRRSVWTRTPNRTCWSSATAGPARAPCCAATSGRSSGRARPSRRSSWSSTTGARCSARCPGSTSSATSRPPPRRSRRSTTWPAACESRLPGPDVTPEQLRDRSWWTGAEVFVVIDDYDLVATQHASPLLALQPLLAQARDTGLHVVVARRSGGASRALVRAGAAVDARPGGPGAAAVGQSRRGTVGRQASGPRPRLRAGDGWSRATGAWRSCRSRGPSPGGETRPVQDRETPL